VDTQFEPKVEGLQLLREFPPGLNGSEMTMLLGRVRKSKCCEEGQIISFKRKLVKVPKGRFFKYTAHVWGYVRS